MKHKLFFLLLAGVGVASAGEWARDTNEAAAGYRIQEFLREYHRVKRLGFPVYASQALLERYDEIYRIANFYGAHRGFPRIKETLTRYVDPYVKRPYAHLQPMQNRIGLLRQAVEQLGLEEEIS